MILLSTLAEKIHSILQNDLAYSVAVTDYDVPTMKNILQVFGFNSGCENSELQIIIALQNRELIENSKQA